MLQNSSTKGGAHKIDGESLSATNVTVEGGTVRTKPIWTTRTLVVQALRSFHVADGRYRRLVKAPEQSHDKTWY